MAKRKTDETGEKPEPPVYLNLIKASTLKSLLKEDDRYEKQIVDLSGELRDMVANSADKNRLDKKAYALLKRFHRMESTEKLANLWNTLLAYMDMAGVMKRIDSVSTLPLESETAGEDGEQTEGDGGGRVARPRFGEPRATA